MSKAIFDASTWWDKYDVDADKMWDDGDCDSSVATEMQECDGCDGRGEYQLLGPVKVCDKCEGRGTVVISVKTCEKVSEEAEGAGAPFWANSSPLPPKLSYRLPKDKA